MNLSKRGVSYSVGTRGLWLTVNKRGLRTTVGVPGTGLGYYKVVKWPQRNLVTPRLRLWSYWLAVIAVIAFAIWY